MAYRKNQTNAQIISLAIRGIEGETTTGNMSTENRGGLSYYGSRGYMPRAWSAFYGERAKERAVLTVIYSYNTPIAWLDREHGWIVPVVSYSPTTSSKHQSLLHRLPNVRRVLVPWDATSEDLERVMDRRMYFGSNGRGGVTRTFPGPNYVAGE